jgi:hypothetical protein
LALITDTISSIDAVIESSWSGKYFLTVDIDWAIDEVISDTLDLIATSGKAATWFVTHPTSIIDSIRKTPRQEIAIHPNFNGLLDGSAEESTADTVLARLLNFVPEARAVRSHSMTQSSRLLQKFKTVGLSHDCNTLIPLSAKMRVRPWKDWNHLTRVPHVWEDDIWLHGGEPVVPLRPIDDCLTVVDFHPIHVALNSPSIDHYESTRTVHRHWPTLRSRRHVGPGVRTWFEEVLQG